MPKIHISRTTTINDKVGEVYALLNNFNSWTKWSPWLITEPDAKVDIREDGKYYTWNGKVVGSGNMTVIEEEVNKRVVYDLTFLSPYRSIAKVVFNVRSVGEEKTEVEWEMDSSLPFFMFFFKKRMEMMIGMDYERGLGMLKEYAEEGLVNSKVKVNGLTKFNGGEYIGIKALASISKMGEKHKSDFEKLMGYVRENGIELDGIPHTVYYKWEPMKDQVEYTAIAPVKSIPKDLPKSFTTGVEEGFDGYSIEHIGSYHHLGNAWSAAFTRQYNKVFKADKRKHPVELYHNSPVDTAPEQLRTEIIMPVK